MILLHARVPLDPDGRDDALDAIADLAEASRAEDGVIDYRATTEVGDGDVVHFVEQYEDEAALGSHTETDHYQSFAAALPEFLAGRPEITRFDVESASELDL
ncbi:MAG TPA: putative quinol monooxygenase [Halobacteriales archaeon]|nr:putative quinol monooxygenase [Halobacteriales archaeon]